jgi:hypothetical protein
MDVFSLVMRLKEEGAAQVKASVDKLNRSFDEASGKAKVYDMTVGSLKDTLSGLASGLALGAVMTKIIDETSGAEFAAAQLNATLKSTKGVAGQSAEALNAHAMALSQMSIFDDDAITGAQSLLLTFTKIHGDTFPKATQAVLNVATAMGTDLKSAAIQVGKALNDPIQGVSALARSGIQFTDAQKEMIAKLVETNRLAQAQAVVLAELETQFGGSAEAARNTFGGAIKALNNELGNLLTLSQNNSSATVQFINLLTNAVVGLNDVLGTLGGLLQSVGGRLQPFVDLLQRAASINMFTPLIMLAARGKQVAADVKASSETMLSAFKAANAYMPFGATGPGTAVPGTVAPPKPKPTGEAIPKIPNLPAIKKEAELTMRQIAEAATPNLAPAINQGATDWLAQSAKAYTERINDLAMQIKFALGDTLGNALADGIQTAIEQKSIGAGFKAMTQTLLRGLGDMMIQFGKASLVASTIMDGIFKALAKALPGGAIVASLAMIAAGAALKGAAGAAFGGGGGRGGMQGMSMPAFSTAMGGGSMGLATQFYGPTAAGSASTIERVNPVNVTIIGPNDPAAQRQMQELVRNAQRRGSV